MSSEETYLDRIERLAMQRAIQRAEIASLKHQLAVSEMKRIYELGEDDR